MMNKKQIRFLKKHGYEINKDGLIVDTQNTLPYAKPYYCMKDQSFKIKLTGVYLSLSDYPFFLKVFANIANLVGELNLLGKEKEQD